MKRAGCLISIFFVVSVLMTSSLIYAQEKQSDKSGWEVSIMSYMSTIGINGIVGAEHKTVHKSIPWSKFKHYIKSGYALALEVRKDRHGVFFDGTYLKLADDGMLRNEPVPVYVDATAKIYNVEAAYSYRVAKTKGYTFDIFAGARYWQFRADLDVAIPVVGYQNSYSDTEKWVDPIIGFVFRPALTQKLFLILRGDIGGFGVGSHFTWKGVGALHYQFFQNIGGQIGYNYTSLDYSKGGFKADVDMQGVYTGLVFRF